MKLSPARRVILLLALLFLAVPTVEVQPESGHFTVVNFGSGIAALLLLLLLMLEVADRVTMKRDLEIAREIQSWLVPEAPPNIPGFEVAFATRPANTVAGDYYDVIPRSSDGAGDRLLVVADVAGKGVPAALLMASFQASLRTLYSTATPLPEQVSALNRYVCTNSQGGRRFTTAFISELDVDSGQLTYVNAGHNPPVLVRGSGQKERLDCGGIPLGIAPAAKYECANVQLCNGDTLLVFTDGLVEAENSSGEEFGENRLFALLEGGHRASDTMNRVMRGVDVFVGSARQHDDITCLVLRRDDQVPHARLPNPSPADE
jgi:sigma-B regulation protein RsbU (phosphoserine phosphatase)